MFYHLYMFPRTELLALKFRDEMKGRRKGRREGGRVGEKEENKRKKRKEMAERIMVFR